MRCVLQRVDQASVHVDGQVIGEIQRGLLVYTAIEPDDGDEELAWMARRICGVRIFNDAAGRFDRSLADVGGAVLSVSQFTLMGDARKGRRPSFSRAAPPDVAEDRWNRFNELLRSQGTSVATGQFGADMRVHSVNAGPVTLIIDR